MNRKNYSMRDSPCRCRSGIVTVMVLVILLLMSALVVEFVRRAISDRRHLRQELQYQQTIQLADAGVVKFHQKRSNDPGYTGETWELPAGLIHQTNTASVVISVSDTVATVTARYPSNAEVPFKVTRTVGLPQ